MILLLTLLAFQLNPELAARVNAGLKAKQAGDLPTAIHEFKRVVELAPNLPAAHTNLGAVYYDSRDYTNAIPTLKRALELNPNLPGAEGMLGASLLAQGYAAESIPHLEKGQMTDLLGVALLEANREREAVDHLEAALQKRPNDPDLLYYLSQAHGRLSKQVYDRLSQQFPDSPRTAQMLGEAHAAANNREVATKTFQAALALRADLHGVHYALGELALTAGDYETAEKEFRAETTLVPGNPAAAYKLGVVLLNKGDAKQALEHLTRANTLKPNMPETLLELGRAQSATGDHTAAEKSFQQILQQEQTTRLAESAHFQLAQLYRKTNRPADAARETQLFQNLRARRANPRE